MTDLAKIAENCARQYFGDLLTDCRGQNFYYFSLVTTVHANRVAASAWSEEALAAEAKNQNCNPEELRWSYADSPYCSYNRREIGMGPLDNVLRKRSDMHDLHDAGREADWDIEFKVRTDALISAMRVLDGENLFAAPEKRADTIIMVDVYDTCFSKHSARQLNSQGSVERWQRSCVMMDCDCEW